MDRSFFKMIKIENFWEKHVGLSLAFDDKFVKRKDSSDLMNAIELYSDPRSDIYLEEPEERLDYIHRLFPKFNPEDPEVKVMTEKLLGLVPELEVVWMREYKSLLKMQSVYENMPMDTEPQIKARMTGRAMVRKEMEELLKIRPKLALARVVGDAGGSVYIQSRVEAGLVGR